MRRPREICPKCDQRMGINHADGCRENVVRRYERERDQRSALRRPRVTSPQPPLDALTEYWATHYASGGHCSLCGNCGVIDTRGITTPAGLEVGSFNYCLCPNGQSLRRRGAHLTASSASCSAVRS